MIEHLAVEAIDHLGGVDDGGLICRAFDLIHQGFKELEVLLIQGAVGAEIAHRLRGQPETAFQLVGYGEGDGDAGAFQHLNHAEETHGVATLDLVVEEGDHQLDGQPGLAVTHRLGIAATGADVIEDPLLMAVLLVDVLGNGAAYPLVLLTQLAAGCH